MNDCYVPLPIAVIALDEAQIGKVTVADKPALRPELLDAIKHPTFANERLWHNRKLSLPKKQGEA